MRESKLENLTDWQQRLVGLEMENLLTTNNGEPINQATVKKLWGEFLKHRWSGQPDYYTGYYTEISKTKSNGKTYNLGNDTGAGIFEMSLPPCQNLHQAKKEFLQILHESLRYIKKQKLRLLAYGIQPAGVKQPPLYKSKKSLYKSFDFLNLHNLIVGTAAEQCGISLKLNELVVVTNELNKISGLILALFANSPISDKKIYPWKELRTLPWDFLGITIKPDLTRLFGFPRKPFNSIADILKYIWEPPTFGMIPFLREGKWVILNRKISHARYFTGKSWAAKDLYGKKIKLIPTPKDLNLALISFWLNAKPHLILDTQKVSVAEFMQYYKNDNLEEYLQDKLLNCYLEYRVASAAPQGEELALPALTLGMIENLSALKKLTAGYHWLEWKKLYEESMHFGLQVKLRGKHIYQLLDNLINLAEVGLKQRKLGEEKYLQPLRKRLADKKCPADYAIEKFKALGYRKFLDYISY